MIDVARERRKGKTRRVNEKAIRRRAMKLDEPDEPVVRE
jgi:hypothetical protein